MKTWRVELALLWSDRTWTTEIFDLPLDEDKDLDGNIAAYVLENLSKQKRYSGLVMAAVYNDAPEDRPEEVR